MGKKLLLCVVIILIINALFSSCSKSNFVNNSKNNSEENKSTNEVVMALHEYIDISPETIEEFNKVLSKKGYDFKLSIKNIDDENYAKDLQQTSCDIAYTGFLGEKDYPLELIKSGFFECLDEYVAKADWCKDIPNKKWDAIKYNGKIYTIPNECQNLEGISIVFNLNKVSKEQINKFDGEITQLDKIVNNKKSIVTGIPTLKFSHILGYSYCNGVVVSLDGKKAYNPFENKDIVNSLKYMNDLYKKGFLIDEPYVENYNRKADEDNKNHFEWSVYITSDLSRIDSQDVNPQVHSTKKVIIEPNNYGATMGIPSNSKNKDNAFKLLSLLHSDSDLANLLIYGSGYEEKDGYAYTSEDTVATNNKFFLGINRIVLKGENDRVMDFYSTEEMKEYYDNNVLESPMKNVTYDNDTTDIVNIEEKYSEIWKSQDINKDLKLVINELKKAGIDEVLTDVNRQLDEFYKDNSSN